MAYTLNPKSISKLVGVHPDLVKVVKRAIQITDIDFTVIEGMRTVARQRQLVAKGASKTMNSRHLTGHAVDIVPMQDGKISWDWPLYYKIAKVMKKAAKDVDVTIEWGGDWKSFKDGPHWQLPFSKYPKTQSFVSSVDDAPEYTNETEKQASSKDAAAIGASGAVGIGASLGESIPDIANVVVNQQSELSSGDWVRIAIAAVILCLTIYGIYRRVKS